jgi:hypothetical protein
MDFTKLTAIQGMKLLKILQDSIIASHTLFFIDEYKSYLDYAKDIQDMEEDKVKLIINNGLIVTIDDIKIKELNTILGLKLSIKDFELDKIFMDLKVWLYASKILGEKNYFEFIKEFSLLNINYKRELLKIAFIGCFDEENYKKYKHIYKKLETGFKIDDFRIKAEKLEKQKQDFNNIENINILFDKLFETHKEFEYITSFFVDTKELDMFSVNLFNNFDNIELYKNFSEYLETCIIKGVKNG